MGWTVTPGPETPMYSYKWTIRRNNAVVLKEGKLDLSSGKDRIEIAGDQPEMIYVAVEPYASLPTAGPHAAAGHGVPLTWVAILAATTDCTRSARLLRPQRSDSRRSVPPTSTPSGTGNWRPKRKFQSSPC